MLSLDRYATVKHPRFTQLRQRQYLPSVLAFVSWFGASVLCAPFLLVYKVAISPPTMSSSNGLQLNPTTTFPFGDGKIINEKKLCVSDYGSDEWHFVFVVSYVGFAFIVPCCGIIFNHLGGWTPLLVTWRRSIIDLNAFSGVRRKLCALSLTARAQHGELPLPMPTILRRPTHMILVTGMTPNGLNVQDSSLASHDDFLSPQRNSMRNSNGGESNQCGVHRLNSNRRFNGSSGSGINPLNKSGLGGTEEENRNLMAETRFRSGPRTPRWVEFLGEISKFLPFRKSILPIIAIRLMVFWTELQMKCKKLPGILVNHKLTGLFKLFHCNNLLCNKNATPGQRSGAIT